MDKIAPAEDDDAGPFNAQAARIAERLEDLLRAGATDRPPPSPPSFPRRFSRGMAREGAGVESQFEGSHCYISGLDAPAGTMRDWDRSLPVVTTEPEQEIIAACGNGMSSPCLYVQGGAVRAWQLGAGAVLAWIRPPSCPCDDCDGFVCVGRVSRGRETRKVVAYPDGCGGLGPELEFAFVERLSLDGGTTVASYRDMR